MKKSAGIVLFRRQQRPEVFLVHPGGPFWKKKDEGAWSIPKGEAVDGEDLLETAKREFYEETGQECSGKFITLDPVKQNAGKLVYAWAVEMDIDPATIKSNLFEMEWPPRSGKMATFPEIDKGDWFNLDQAMIKIIEGQRPILEQLSIKLNK